MQNLRLEEKKFKNWNLFIKALSVEIFYKYTTEMDLNLTQEIKFKIIKLARACLEVFYYSAIEIKLRPGDSWHFPKYWKVYRKSNGVLSDLELRKFKSLIYQYLENQRFEHSSYYCLIPFVYNELYEWIGLEWCNLLEDWFENNFRGHYVEFSEYPFIYSESIDKLIAILPAPLNKEQCSSINKINSKFYNERVKISNRIEILEEKSKTKKGTLWDNVLHTFPIDSSINGKFIPGSLKYCLRYQLIKKQMNEYKQTLGISTFNDYFDWIKKVQTIRGLLNKV